MKVNTLRSKTLFIIILTSTILIVTFFIISYTLLRQEVLRVEDDAIRQELNRANTVLSLASRDLNFSASLFGNDSRVFSYISQKQQYLIDFVFTAQTFSNYEVDWVVLMDTTGNTVYAQTFNDEKQTFGSILPGLVPYLERIHPTFSESAGSSGLLGFPGKPMAIAYYPVYLENSKFTSGTVIVGRYLDDSELNFLEDFSGIHITFLEEGNELLPEAEIPSHVAGEKFQPYIHRIDKTTITGYVRQNTLEPGKYLYLQVTSPRPTLEKATSILSFYILLFGFLGLIFTAVNVYIVTRSVVERIEHLDQAVNHVTFSGDLSHRLKPEGDDEMASLAGSVNELLNRIEQAQKEIITSHAHYEGVVSQVSEGILLADPDTLQIFEVNQAFVDLLGLESKQVVLDKQSEARDIDFFLQIIHFDWEKRKHITKEISTRRMDGTPIDLEVDVDWINFDEQTSLCMIIRDITQRKHVERDLMQAHEDLEDRVAQRTVELARANHILKVEMLEKDETREQLQATLASLEQMKNIINKSPVIVFRCKATHGLQTVYVSENVTQLGYQAEEITSGKISFLSTVHPRDQKHVEEQIQIILKEQVPEFSSEFQLLTTSGDARWVVLQAWMVSPHKKAKEYQGIIVDITDRKQNEQVLEYLSIHDSLTNLFNRAYFDMSLQRLEANGQYPISIIVVDVDRLKLINDGLGHLAGDLLIQRTGQVLQASFRHEDIVARVGGDEFAAIIQGASVRQLNKLIERARSMLRKNNRRNDTSPDLSFSIGYATTDTPCSLRELFNQADQAMYAEKQRHHQSREFQSSSDVQLINS